MIHYPYSIRADAITAVGAPSSVSFLMKAIFWLYLVVRTFYHTGGSRSQVLKISEENEDELLSNEDVKSSIK